MELPTGETTPKQRNLTGEVMYLDEMRRFNQAPKRYADLGDMAIQLYEAEAGLYAQQGQQPDIMAAFEQFDSKPSPAMARCRALADELLKLKDPESPFTFVDIVVDMEPEAVLAKLKAIKAGDLLAGDDAQLAIPSDGSYYPILDMRKNKARFTGVGVTIWGWDDDKYVFTNGKDEPYEYPRHALVYPSDEKSSSRQIEVSFSYVDDEAGPFRESVTLSLPGNGGASFSSQIGASAYAETGYEGHGGKSRSRVSAKDILAFGEFVAEIVGDEPETTHMRTDRRLRTIADRAATDEGRAAIGRLVETTWGAQAIYFLSRRFKDQETSIANMLSDASSVDAGIAAIDSVITLWNKQR